MKHVKSPMRFWFHWSLPETMLQTGTSGFNSKSKQHVYTHICKNVYMYIYIYIYGVYIYMCIYKYTMYICIDSSKTCHLFQDLHQETSGRSSGSPSSAGSTAADGSGSSCTAVPRSSSGPTPGAPAPVDHWSQQINLENSWLFAFFKCEIKREKKLPQCEDFFGKNVQLLPTFTISSLIFVHKCCTPQKKSRQIPPCCVTTPLRPAAALSAASTWCIKGPRFAAPAALEVEPITTKGWFLLGIYDHLRSSKIIIFLTASYSHIIIF